MTTNNNVTLTRATNILYDGMATREQGWELKFNDGSRLAFYKKKKDAKADVEKYGLRVVSSH